MSSQMRLQNTNDHWKQLATKSKGVSRSVPYNPNYICTCCLILNDTKEFPKIVRVFYDVLVTTLLAMKNDFITLVRRDI